MMPKNMGVIRVALIISALLCSPVYALGATVQVLGHGAKSCGSWLQSRNTQSYNEAAQTSWVMGFVTAFNNYGEPQPPSGNISGGTDADGLLSWIDAYCQANPLDTVFRASAALIRELQRRSVRH